MLRVSLVVISVTQSRRGETPGPDEQRSRGAMRRYSGKNMDRRFANFSDPPPRQNEFLETSSDVGHDLETSSKAIEQGDRLQKFLRWQYAKCGHAMRAVAVRGVPDRRPDECRVRGQVAGATPPC